MFLNGWNGYMNKELISIIYCDMIFRRDLFYFFVHSLINEFILILAYHFKCLYSISIRQYVKTSHKK